MRTAQASKLPAPVPLPGPRPARLPTAPREHRRIVIAGIAVAVVAIGAAVGLYLLEGEGAPPAEAKASAGGSAAAGAAGAAPDPATPAPRAPAPAAPAPSTPPAAASPPSRPAPEEAAPPILLPPGAPLRLVIRTTPSDATVLLDGKRLGHTPYSGTVEAASGKHSLRIRRQGYSSVSLEVKLDSDLTRDVTLQRAKEEPAP